MSFDPFSGDPLLILTPNGADLDTGKRTVRAPAPPYTELVSNPFFSKGSDGWALGSGASVRQQGWVARVPANSAWGRIENDTPVACVNGDVFTLCYAWLKSSDYTGDTPYIGIYRFDTYTGGNLGAVVQYTKDQTVSTDWETNFVTMTATGAGYVVALAECPNTATAGEIKVGYMALVKNGVLVNQFWDFSQGLTGWRTYKAGVTVTYDPSNAYLGNSFDGTARNTLVQNNETDYDDAYSQVCGGVVPGQVLRCTLAHKAMVTGDGSHHALKISFFASIGGAWVSDDAFDRTAIDTAWHVDTKDITVPAGATAWQAVPNSWYQTSPGLWLVGYVSLQRLPDYNEDHYGNITVSPGSGQPVMDQGVQNQVTISLFTRPGWCGNIFLAPREQIGSDFLDAIRGGGITLSRLTDIADAAKRALASDAFPELSVTVTNPRSDDIAVTVQVGPGTAPLTTLRQGGNWIAQASNPAYKRQVSQQ